MPVSARRHSLDRKWRQLIFIGGLDLLRSRKRTAVNTSRSGVRLWFGECYVGAVLDMRIIAIAVTSCMQGPHVHAPLPPVLTFGEYGAQTVVALRQDLWDDGRWHSCDGGCRSANQDWGDDSLTYVLYMQWLTTHDASLVPMFAA